MTIPTAAMLALMAGVLGALAEQGMLALFRSNFAARMFGYGVAALVVLAGTAGAFRLGI